MIVVVLLLLLGAKLIKLINTNCMTLHRMETHRSQNTYTLIYNNYIHKYCVQIYLKFMLFKFYVKQRNVLT